MLQSKALDGPLVQPALDVLYDVLRNIDSVKVDASDACNICNDFLPQRSKSYTSRCRRALDSGQPKQAFSHFTHRSTSRVQSNIARSTNLDIDGRRNACAKDFEKSSPVVTATTNSKLRASGQTLRFSRLPQCNSISRDVSFAVQCCHSVGRCSDENLR